MKEDVEQNIKKPEKRGKTAGNRGLQNGSSYFVNYWGRNEAFKNKLIPKSTRLL